MDEALFDVVRALGPNAVLRIPNGNAAVIGSENSALAPFSPFSSRGRFSLGLAQQKQPLYVRSIGAFIHALSAPDIGRRVAIAESTTPYHTAKVDYPAHQKLDHDLLDQRYQENAERWTRYAVLRVLELNPDAREALLDLGDRPIIAVSPQDLRLGAMPILDSYVGGNLIGKALDWARTTLREQPNLFNERALKIGETFNGRAIVPTRLDLTRRSESTQQKTSEPQRAISMVIDRADSLRS
ncbi:MAG: NADAR family protein, partial [Vulcanimicrobiaceae bacterium]